MEILGVGGMELMLILLIALIFAGPKRMLQWSYTLGKYVAQIRKMWSEAAGALQSELDQAGVDVQVPKDLPTRAAISQEFARQVNKYGAPIKEPLKEVKADLDKIKGETQIGTTPIAPKAAANGAPAKPPAPAASPTPKPADPPADDLGTWSAN